MTRQVHANFPKVSSEQTKLTVGLFRIDMLYSNPEKPSTVIYMYRLVSRSTISPYHEVRIGCATPDRVVTGMVTTFSEASKIFNNLVTRL